MIRRIRIILRLQTERPVLVIVPLLPGYSHQFRGILEIKLKWILFHLSANIDNTPLTSLGSCGIKFAV